MRRRFVVPWLIAVLLPGTATTLEAQSAAAACADSIGRSMAFLQGDWEGDSYSITSRDTVLDAHMKVHCEPLFGRCALE
jgi:hypothetical protein